MAPKFLYHALASGVSGNITLPVQYAIEVQAPTTIPFTGGHSLSRKEAFRCEHYLSFGSAETVTTGTESSQYFNTLATSTIEGLNILNMVTADRVVARLASRYVKDTGEQLATFAGSYFANLRIAGCPVKVDIDPVRLKSFGRSEKVLFGTIAAPIKLDDCWGLERLEDGAIYLPQFGKIYLAEALITPCYQSLSMFRVVLGCAVEGHIQAAFASTNGEPMPG